MVFSFKINLTVHQLKLFQDTLNAGILDKKGVRMTSVLYERDGTHYQFFPDTITFDMKTITIANADAVEKLRMTDAVIWVMIDGERIQCSLRHCAYEGFFLTLFNDWEQHCDIPTMRRILDGIDAIVKPLEVADTEGVEHDTTVQEAPESGSAETYSLQP